VPKVDVQFGVAYQHAPGPQITAQNGYLPSQIPVLTGFRFVNLVQPGTMYTDSVNQLDLRFSKIFKTGQHRFSANFDLNNAFNSSGVLGQNGNYGSSWLAPLNIIDARLIKVSGQWDF
jgi:hypothetical protein